LLPVEEDGQSVRAIETATGDVVVAGSAMGVKELIKTTVRKQNICFEELIKRTDKNYCKKTKYMF
jgi:hypothetical protein